MKNHNLKALGRKVTKFTKLETFEAPKYLQEVTCVSDEVTAVCPVTGQPDQYTVTIHYYPNGRCVESKTLKLFLQSFRNEGHFCEQFSQIIAERFIKDLNPLKVSVTVVQKPRGGVSIHASSEMHGKPDAESEDY